jgi:hypothetical protein
MLAHHRSGDLVGRKPKEPGDEVDRMLLTMASSSRALDNTKQNRCDFNVSNPAPSDNALFGCECDGGLGWEARSLTTIQAQAARASIIVSLRSTARAIAEP